MNHKINYPKYTLRFITMALAALLFAVLTPGGQFAGSAVQAAEPNTLLLTQEINDGYTTAFGPSTVWPGQSDKEVADDFELTGQIERLVAVGKGCANCSPPQIDGVYVRFYEHTPAGPGALQAEYFLEDDDPGFIYNPDQPSTLDITLPSPFQANGRHFFTVQMAMSGVWEWWESSRNAPTLSRIWIRDNLDGGQWQHYDVNGRGNADVTFDLYGQLTAPPKVNSLSHVTLDRSGRLRLFGSNFYQLQGSGQVLVDGQPAPISHWSGMKIHAYVPETAGPGPVDVQVVTDLGGGNAVNLDVTLRQPVGRLNWRFEADGLYSQVRPALGPDGSIYAVDVRGNLYGLSPDGGLKFVYPNAGGDGLDVGPDGVIYAGDGQKITAVNPDGSLRWVFQQNPWGIYLQGPSVGPDGNIYVVATGGLGVFSLTPDGVLRWNEPEIYRGPPILYQEIQFGYDGGTLQFYFHANTSFKAFTSNGDLAWAYGPLFGQGYPDVGPDQTIYNKNVFRYDPDGNQIDSYFVTDGSTAPRVSDASGNVYHASPGRLRSFTPDLDLRWNNFLGYVLGVPHPDPTDQVVVVNAAETYGVSGMALAVNTADGQEAWRVPFTPLPVGIHIGGSNPRFSPDGALVYLNSQIAGPKPGDNYWYLNAIETDPTLINLPPAATADSYQTLPNTPLTLPAATGLLGNDNDPDGGVLLAAAVSDPANGTLMLDTAGSLQYMPNTGFIGTDTFTYQVSDGDHLSNIVEVTIEVTADDNTAPTAVNDNYTMQQDGTLVMAAPGVLANDSDPDGDPLTAVLETNPASGSVTLDADGSFTYTPVPGFAGTDTFTYRAGDGTAQSNVAAVTLNVLPEPNQAPIAVGDAYSTTMNVELVVTAPGVLGNDSDGDGDSLTAVLVSSPADGQLSLNPDGSFSYTPDNGFSGQDTFTYQAYDGLDYSDPVTVTITVEFVPPAEQYIVFMPVVIKP